MLRVLSFAALIPFSSQPAHAASFSAFVAGGLTGGCGTETEQVLNSSSALNLTASGSGPGCGTDAKARASDGSVGVLTTFASNKKEPGELSPLGSVRASASFTDRIFIVPNGMTLKDVPELDAASFAGGVNAAGLMDVRMRFGFSGSLQASTSSLTSFRGKTASATLETRIDVSATTGGCCGTYDPFDYFKRYEVIASASNGEELGSVSEIIARSFLHVPTAGIGVTVRMNGQAGAGGFGGSTDTSVATASSLNSLGYYKSVSVFDLPDGFTAYSESGFIVNNRLVGVDDVTPVPLPAGMPLLLAGLGGFAFLRRRS